MKMPTSEQILKFVEVFDKLSQFEAEQRVIRGHGCFVEEEIPIKGVKKVRDWLQKQAKTKDKDAIGEVIAKFERKAEDLRVESASAQAMNDYIQYETLCEEAEIYEEVVTELKGISGVGKIKYK